MLMEARQVDATALAAAAAANRERELRRRLGVPDEAREVLVFGETSHWDPNWLHTTEEYYGQRIRAVLDAAIAELQREPGRVFAVESLFFLQRYWQDNPRRRRVLGELLESGRLRLSGSGITTPDTVLPDTEAILRDYLHGQQWLRAQGIAVEPRVAYLPDDFGHSPALPAILSALGVRLAAITRIDGMHFVGSDYRRAREFPLPGSSAELLARDLRTADFVWRAPDGSEVLTHWNAFTYFQGDMLAHVGIIRWMGTAFGLPWRTRAHVARRVRGYAAQLRPLARTPYLFCPIGCDFNEPIPGLLGLLDRYNARDYPTTGVWAVSAGLDDYLDLVGCHREALPAVALDPNPYWMGFYASRPAAKRRCNRIVRKLVLAEKLTALAPAATGSRPGAAARDAAEQRAIGSAWDLAVLSNHHDFITGTSPDRIWHQEQLPWLARAEGLADRVLRRISAAPASPSATAPGPGSGPPRWRRQGGRIEVETQAYRMLLDEARGGCIVELEARRGEAWHSLLRGPANDAVLYRDSGGLWRLGHEFRGGVFAEIARASDAPATITANERGAVLELRVDAELGGRPIVRWLWLRWGEPIIRMRLAGSLAARRTLTCRFDTGLLVDGAAMDVPGGVVRRAPNKIFEPTFWPARSFVHVCREAGGWGLAGFLGGPAAVSFTEQGRVEWIALRNAPKERAFGLLPVLAHPAGGTDPGEGSFDYAVWLTPEGDYRANAIPKQVRRALRGALKGDRAAELERRAGRVVAVDHPDVLVSAVKRAVRGPGVIVRLQALSGWEEQLEVALSCAGRPIREATLCDALERDLLPLRTDGGAARVPIRGAITSVRLLLAGERQGVGLQAAGAIGTSVQPVPTQMPSTQQ